MDQAAVPTPTLTGLYYSSPTLVWIFQKDDTRVKNLCAGPSVFLNNRDRKANTRRKIFAGIVVMKVCASVHQLRGKRSRCEVLSLWLRERKTQDCAPVLSVFPEITNALESNTNTTRHRKTVRTETLQL